MTSPKRWRLHPSARDEVDEKAARYDRERAGLGADFVAAYEATFARIVQDPKMGSVERLGKHSFRRALFDRFPYAIVFVETDDAYVIVAVTHVRRDPTYWRRRLTSAR